MAIMQTETITIHTLKLSQEEMVALRKYLGKSSTNDMLSKSLDRKQSEMVTSIFYVLNNESTNQVSGGG